MNNIIVPSINPIRLYPTVGDGDSITIDYSTHFPHPDLMQVGTSYQKGVTAFDKYITDWVVGFPIYFQMQTNGSMSSVTAKLLEKYGSGYRTVIITDITPDEWVGYNVKKFTITSTSSSGYYYMYLSFVVNSVTYTFKSNVIYISKTLSTDKNLVYIKFKNSFNDFNYVFDNYYNAFYSAIFKIQPPSTEITTFESDTKYISNSRSYGKLKLTLCDIPDLFIEQVSQQFRCDSIILNEVEYIAEEGISVEETNKTDIVDINIMLTRKNDINSKFYF